MTIAEPAAFTPMRLPITTWPLPRSSRLPAVRLPLSTFRSAADVPPTVLPAPLTDRPPATFASAAAPAASVPTWLPWIVVPLAFDTRPHPVKPPIARPRTREPVAVPSSTRPFTEAPALAPESRTTGVAVQPGCADASTTSGAVTEGSADTGAIVATPPEPRFSAARSPPAARFNEPPAPVVPFGIMNTTCSMPAVRPACASDASSPSPFALTIACRSEPAPASLTLTTVEKLKPKSTPVASAAPSVTGATDCAVALAVVSDASVALVVFDGASASAGDSPPTRSATAATVAPLASVRKVCTGRCVPRTKPVRAEVTVSWATRTL